MVITLTENEEMLLAKIQELEKQINKKDKESFSERLISKIENLEKEIMKSNERKLGEESKIFKNEDSIKKLALTLQDIWNKLFYIYFVNILTLIVGIFAFLFRNNEMSIFLWIILFVLIVFNLFLGFIVISKKFIN
jgi:hypothetical protein